MTSPCQGAGAWSDAIAAGVPTGSTVVIRTDPDEPGERYAATIARNLESRRSLLRPVRKEVA